jgi:O-antigen/teichoic acid export membrane protein
MSDDVYASLRWVTASRAIAQVVAWLSTILVVRLLSPGEFGVVAMATVFVGYLSFIGDFGLGPGLVSRCERDVQVLSAAHGACIMVGLVLFATIAATAPLVAMYFKNDAVSALVQVSALMFVFSGVSAVPRAMLTIDMRFREISIAGMMSSLLTTITTLSLAYAGAGAWSLVVGSAVGALAMAVMFIRYAGVLRVTLSFSKLRGLTRFSVYTLAERTVWYWYSQVDSLIVGRLLGDRVLGFLTVGKDLAAAPVSKAVEISNQVAFPAFARLQGQRQSLAENYVKVVRISSTLGFPVLWGLALTAPDLVSLLLGERWADVSLVVQILAIMMPLRFAAAVSATLLQSVGRVDLAFRNTTVSLAILVLLLSLGSSRGLVGVTVAWAVAIPAGFALAVRSATRYLDIGMRSVLLEIAAAAAPAALMLVLCVILQVGLSETSPVLRLVSTIAFGIAAWMVGLFFFARKLWKEVVEVLLNLIRGRRKIV